MMRDVVLARDILDLDFFMVLQLWPLGVVILTHAEF